MWCRLILQWGRGLGSGILEVSPVSEAEPQEISWTTAWARFRGWPCLVCHVTCHSWEERGKDTWNLRDGALGSAPHSFFCKIFFFFIHEKHTHTERERGREAETQAEGEADSMQGA